MSDVCRFHGWVGNLAYERDEHATCPDPVKHFDEGDPYLATVLERVAGARAVERLIAIIRLVVPLGAATQAERQRARYVVAAATWMNCACCLNPIVRGATMTVHVDGRGMPIAYVHEPTCYGLNRDHRWRW